TIFRPPRSGRWHGPAVGVLVACSPGDFFVHLLPGFPGFWHIGEPTMKTVRVGLVGSQFIASIHCEALRSVPATEIVAVTSAREANAKAFAERHGIPRWFTDYHKMYEMPDLDLVILGLPNDLHCDAAVAAAAAGKHVLCEKPLCLNLAEADRMIEACQK